VKAIVTKHMAVDDTKLCCFIAALWINFIITIIQCPNDNLLNENEGTIKDFKIKTFSIVIKNFDYLFIVVILYCFITKYYLQLFLCNGIGEAMSIRGDNLKVVWYKLSTLS